MAQFTVLRGIEHTYVHILVNISPRYTGQILLIQVPYRYYHPCSVFKISTSGKENEVAPIFPDRLSKGLWMRQQITSLPENRPCLWRDGSLKGELQMSSQPKAAIQVLISTHNWEVSSEHLSIRKLHILESTAWERGKLVQTRQTVFIFKRILADKRL